MHSSSSLCQFPWAKMLNLHSHSTDMYVPKMEKEVSWLVIYHWTQPKVWVIGQSEASIEVTWSVLTNQRPVLPGQTSYTNAHSSHNPQPQGSSVIRVTESGSSQRTRRCKHTSLCSNLIKCIFQPALTILRYEDIDSNVYWPRDQRSESQSQRTLHGFVTEWAYFNF